MEKGSSGAPRAGGRFASAAGLALVLLVLGAPPPRAATPAPEHHHLRVVAAPCEPFAFERGGLPTGLDVDLLTLVCRANGWTYELEWAPFGEVFDRLRSGRADLAIGALYGTAERRAAFACSEPYLRTGLVLVSRPDRPVAGAGALGGLRVGVKERATGQEWARRQTESGARFVVVPFAETRQSFDALVRGEVDVVLNDSANSAYLIARDYPGQAVIARGLLGPDLLTQDVLVFPFRPGLAGARDTFDATLRELRAGGVLDRLLWTWVQPQGGTDLKKLAPWGLGLLALAAVSAGVLWWRRRRHRERLLSDSERHYRLLVEDAPLGVLLLRGGRVGYANRAACALLGAAPEALRGRQMLDLVAPSDREHAAPALAAGGRSRAWDAPLLRAGGGTFPAHLTLRPTADAAGEGALIFFEDTTERDAARVALRETAERERLWVQHGADVVLVHDLEGRYIQCLGVDWLGYTPDQVIGKTPHDFNGPREAEEILARVRRAVATGRGEVVEVKDTVQGRTVYFSEFTAPVPDDAGRITSVARICRNITAQKEAEASLRESERRLSALLANLPGMAYRFRLEEGMPLEYASDGARELTGYPPEALLSEGRIRWEDLVHPEDRERRREEIEQALRAGRPYRVTYRIRTAAGQVRWLLSQGRPVMDEVGVAIAAEGFVTDITPRVRAEEALRRSEEQYRLLVENQSDLVVKLDGAGRLLFVSPSFCDLFGKSEGELLGESLLPVTHEDDRGPTLEALSGLAAPPHATYLEQRAMTRHGWRWVAWSFRSVQPGEAAPAQIIGVGRDVTAQRAIAEALSESETRFRTLAETTAAAILIFQEDRLAYANPAAAALMGRPPEEMAHLTFWEAFHPQDLEFLRMNLSTPTATPFEARVVQRGGALRWVQCSAGAILFGGRPATVLTAFDVTERRTAEAEARAAREHLQRVVSNIPLVVFALDPDGVFTLSEGSALSLLGLRPGEVVGRSALELYRGVPAILDNLRRALAGESCTWVQEIQGRQFETWVVPFGRPGDPRRGVLGVANDITDRVRAAEALRESEHRFRHVFEQAPLGMVLPDAEFRLLEANAAFCDMLGYSADELRSLSFRDITHPEDLAASEVFMGRMARGELAAAEAQKRYLHKSGRVVWGHLKVSPLRDRQGNLLRYLALVEDITARKEAEAALRESEARLRTILAQSPIAMALVALDGTIEYINQKAVETFGYLPEDIPNMDRWWSQAYPDPAYREEVVSTWMGLVEKALAQGCEIEGREYRATCKDGSVKSVFIFGVPVADKVFVMFQDVTERVRVEAALRESEAQYRLTINAMTDAVHLVGRDLRILLSNSTLQRWADDLHLEGAIVGRTPFEVFPFLPDQVRQEYERVFESGAPLVSHDRQMVGGAELFTETRKIPVLEGGRVARVLTVIRDVTERHRAEEALRTSEARLRTILEQSPISMALMAQDGTIEFVNRRVTETTGYGPEDLPTLDRWMEQAFPDPAYRQQAAATWATLVQRASAGGRQVEGHEFQVTCKDGAVKTALIYGVPVAGKVFVASLDLTERQAAERALRESEARLRTILEQSPIAMAIQGADGAVEFINRKFEETFGYTPQDIPTFQRWAELAYPDAAYREELIGTWARWIEEARAERGELQGGEVQVTCKDGTVRTVYIFGVPIADKVLAMLQDVTARREAEDAIRRERDFSASALESLPGIFYVITSEGKFLRWNTNLETVSGYTAEEIAGMSPLQMFEGEERDLIARRIQSVFESGYSTAEAHLVARSGLRIPFFFNGKRTVMAGRPCLIGMGIDISVRKAAEEALQESEARFRQVFDNSYDAMFVAQADTGRLLDANRRALELVGRTLDEIRSMHQMELHPPEERERYRAIFEAHQGAQAGLSTLDLLAIHRDGRRIPVDISGSAFELGGRRLQIGIFHDITERKRAEAELRRFQFMLDHAGDEVYLVRSDGSLAYANEAAARSLGYTLEELYALGVRGIDPDYGPRYSQHMAELKARDLPPFETVHIARDGRRVPKEIKAVYLSFGQEEFVYGTGRDISERRATEALLRENEERYRVIAEQTGQLVYDYDVATGHIQWSGALFNLTGFLPGEFLCDIGEWEERIHPDDREAVLGLVDGAVSSAGRFQVEYRFRQRGGSYLPVEDRGVCLAGPDGRTARMLGTMADQSLRKEAEAEALASTARLHHLLTTSPTIIYSCRTEGDFAATYVSDNVLPLLHLRPEQFTSESSFWASRIHPGDAQRVFDGLGAVFETGTHTHQYRFLDGQGRWRWMRDELRLTRDPGGKPLELVGSWTDVTDLAEAEEALKRSEADYRRLFENAHDAILIFEPEGEVILDANPAACALYGLPREQLVGTSLEGLSVDPERGKPKIQQTLAVGALVGFETRHRRADGAVIDVEVNAAAVVFGGRHAILSIHRDVTDRRAAEEAVQRSRERLQLILDRSPLACILWDPQFRATLWNPAAERLFGFSLPQALGRHPYELIVPPEAQAHTDVIWARLLEGDETAHSENENFTSSGKRILCEWYNTPLKDAGGRVVGVLSMAQDVTARRAAEAQVLLRNRQLSALLASAQAMTGFLDLKTSARSICEAALSAFDLRMAWVGLVVPEDTEVRVLASAGQDDGYTEMLRVRWDESPRSQGPVGRSIKTRKVVTAGVDDPSFAPWRDAALARGYRSVCALPLVHEDAVRGAMNLYSANPEAFGPDTLETLEIFARQCTMVVVNASLYEEAHRMVQELLSRTERP